MTRERFEAALHQVLRHEGGYVDHPADPGGATKYGITRAVLAAWRKAEVSKADMRALTSAQAGEIYHARYWQAVRADELPQGLDFAMFDFAVNSGPSRAIRFLQAVLGVEADGQLGPTSMAALKQNSPEMLIMALSARRRAFLERLPGFAVFGRGWSRRVRAVETEALRMASQARKPSAFPANKPSILPSTKEMMTMDMTKSMLSSRTVWANLIGLGAILLTLFGFNTNGVDANALADRMLEVVAGISFVASTLFRIVASKKIA